MTKTQDFASKTFLSADGTEVSANGAPVGSAEEQLQKYTDVETLREKVRELTAERDQLQTQLDAVPAHQQATEPGLPADALERLVAVKGIGESLAKQALDALTAAPAPAEQ